MPTSDLRSNQVDRLTSKVVDQKGRQAKNGGDATDPQDFVTLKQLKSGLSNIGSNGGNSATTNFLNTEFLTPHMFGAVGDGITDDTAAWNALIAASIATGKPIVGNGNPHLVSKQGTSVIPFSTNTRAYVFLLTVPITIEGYVNFVVDQTNITNGPPSIFFFKQVDGARINGVSATGTGTQTFPPILYSGAAILFDRCTNCIANQIFTNNMRGNTLFFQSTNCAVINSFSQVDAVFLTTSGSHFASYSSSHIFVDHCIGYGGTGDGDFTHFGGPATKNIFSFCEAYNYQFGDATKTIVNPGNQGILLDSGQDFGIVQGCNAYGYYYGIDVKTTGEGLTVLGNTLDKCKVGISARLGEGNAPTYNTIITKNTIRPLGGNGDATSFLGLTSTLGIWCEDARGVQIEGNTIEASTQFGPGEQDYIPILCQTTQALIENVNTGIRIRNNQFINVMNVGGTFTYTRNASIVMSGRSDAPFIRSCISGNEFKHYSDIDGLLNPILVFHAKQFDFSHNEFTNIIGDYECTIFSDINYLRCLGNSFDQAPGFYNLTNCTQITISDNQFGDEVRRHSTSLPVAAIYCDTCTYINVSNNQQVQGGNNDDGYFFQTSSTGNQFIVLSGNNLKKNLFLPQWYQVNGVDGSTSQDVSVFGNIINGVLSIGSVVSTRTFAIRSLGGNWIVDGVTGAALASSHSQAVSLQTQIPPWGKIRAVNLTVLDGFSGSGFSSLIAQLGDASAGGAYYTVYPFDLLSGGNFLDVLPLNNSVNQTSSNLEVVVTANQNLDAATLTGAFTITIDWVNVTIPNFVV